MLPNKKYKNDYNDDIQNYDNNLYDNHDNHNHGNINYTHYAQNHINLIRIYWTEVILAYCNQSLPCQHFACYFFRRNINWIQKSSILIWQMSLKSFSYGRQGPTYFT